ncbi:MAG: thioredoxin domain-containing protein, partial [bacterium]
MKNTQKTIFFIVIIVLVLGAVATFIIRGGGPVVTVNYDAFATCLKDKGAVFYGAFWCPHCQAQKKEFGSSAKLLPYVECSTPDGQAQTQICIDKKIEGYPTWVFADGSKLTGAITLQQLADKTSCPLPADTSKTTTP